MLLGQGLRAGENCGQAVGIGHLKGDEQSYRPLAGLYRRAGAYDKAAAALERVLAIRESTAGPDDVSLVPIVSSLARVYDALEHYDRAERGYLRAVALSERAYGPDDIRLGVPLQALKDFYDRRTRYADAAGAGECVLDILRRSPHATVPELAVALNNLVNSSTGVKEYNVHFAGAFIAALPTLVVYMLSGKYFVRGLMAGSVKG